MSAADHLSEGLFPAETVPSKEEQSQRKKALKAVSPQAPLHVSAALAKSTVPVEDFSALEGVRINPYTGGERSGHYLPESTILPTAIDEGGYRPPSLAVDYSVGTAGHVRTAVHELGHAIQYKGVHVRTGPDGVYGEYVGDESGTPHIQGDPEYSHQKYSHERTPWVEGAASGYEARHTPLSVSKKIKKDPAYSYDNPDNWKSYGEHAYSTYSLAKGTAARTGDPGSIPAINAELKPLLHGTDIGWDEKAQASPYHDAVRRMVLNYTARHVAPDQFNMLAAPYEGERRKRTEAAGLEFKPRGRPEFGDRTP